MRPQAALTDSKPQRTATNRKVLVFQELESSALCVNIVSHVQTLAAIRKAAGLRTQTAQACGIVGALLATSSAYPPGVAATHLPN
jgi:hypothetical protein